MIASEELVIFPERVVRLSFENWMVEEERDVLALFPRSELRRRLAKQILWDLNRHGFLVKEDLKKIAHDDVGKRREADALRSVIKKLVEYGIIELREGFIISSHRVIENLERKLATYYLLHDYRYKISGEIFE